MSSPKVKFPEPSEEERALQGEQLSLLRGQKDIMSRQLREQQLLLPMLYSQMGLKPQFGEGGEIVGFDQDPEFAQDTDMQRRIQRMMMQRSEQALRGELPVGSGLTRELGDQQQQLESSLAAQLGPGAMASTAGQSAMADFNQRKAELLQGAQRGDIDFFQQHSLAQNAANLQGRNQNIGQAATLSSLLGSTGQQLGGIAGGMGGIMNRLMQGRQGQFQAGMFNAQQPGVGSMLGSMGGLLAGSFLGPLGAGVGGSMGQMFGKQLFGF